MNSNTFDSMGKRASSRLSNYDLLWRKQSSFLIQAWETWLLTNWWSAVLTTRSTPILWCIDDGLLSHSRNTSPRWASRFRWFDSVECYLARENSESLHLWGGDTLAGDFDLCSSSFRDRLVFVWKRTSAPHRCYRWHSDPLVWKNHLASRTHIQD